MSRLLAIVFACAIGLALPSSGGAQHVIQTQEGACFGASPIDGRSVSLNTCNLAFQISYTHMGTIRADLLNGSTQCLDGYQGRGNPVEAVACDGTPEQNWELNPFVGTFTNLGTGLCMEASRGQVVNAPCRDVRRQHFLVTSPGVSAIAAAPAVQGSSPGSFGSGVATAGAGITPGGGSLVGPDGSSLVGPDGSSLVGPDGSSLVGPDGSSLVGPDGSSLVGPDGSSLIGNQGGGYSIQSAGCRDPWLTQAIGEVAGRAPQGSGDSGECWIGHYNNGSWNSYEELREFVRARVAPGTGSRCRDPWITQAIAEVAGRGPIGAGDSGECDIRNYNHGSWNSYEELKGYVRTRLGL